MSLFTGLAGCPVAAGHASGLDDLPDGIVRVAGFDDDLADAGPGT
jgi:hypothetical protein